MIIKKKKKVKEYVLIGNTFQHSWTVSMMINVDVLLLQQGNSSRHHYRQRGPSSPYVSFTSNTSFGSVTLLKFFSIYIYMCFLLTLNDFTTEHHFVMYSTNNINLSPHAAIGHLIVHFFHKPDVTILLHSALTHKIFTNGFKVCFFYWNTKVDMYWLTWRNM